MLHCRVQLMNSQREEDDDINQKLSKSQQAATYLTSYQWQEIIFPLIATLHNIHTTPFSCRLSKDQQHAKKIADSKLLTTLS
jgi:hypothetical protein